MFRIWLVLDFYLLNQTKLEGNCLHDKNSKRQIFYLKQNLQHQYNLTSLTFRFPLLPNDKVNPYHCRLLGKLNDLMRVKCLAHSIYSVPCTDIPCCTSEYHCIKWAQKMCYLLQIMSLRVGED